MGPSPPCRVPSNSRLTPCRPSRASSILALRASRRRWRVLSDGTWQNALTLTRFAMRRAGIIKSPARQIVRFAPDWTAALKLPALKHDQIGLSRLARFCTERGIAPDGVDDSVFDKFLVELTTNAIIKQPHKVHRRAATIWNKLAMTTRNWPNQTVTVPNYSKVYALGWDRFPASLVGEINAHLDRVAGTDILAQLEGKTLKPSSVKTRRQQLCAYVSALVHAGEDPANLKTLADVVEVARVKKGLHFLPEARWKRIEGAGARHRASTDLDRPPRGGRG